jgi:hypothetical protein
MAESSFRHDEWLQVRLTDGERRELETTMRNLRSTQERLDALERECQELLGRVSQAVKILDSEAVVRARTDEARLLRDWQLTESRLFDASARRLHEFERRLEHEWLALRQLHEEPIKALEERAAAAQETLARAEANLRATESTRHAAADEPLARAASPLPWLALAAALGAAVYAGYLHWRVAPGVGRAVEVATLAEQRASEAQQTIRQASEPIQRAAETGEAAVRSDRIAQVLAAADLRRYPLTAYQFAPAATGQALWSRARGLVISVSQLPAAPSGQVYQAWLVTPAGMISAGEIAPDARGRVSATFDTPADLPGTVTGVFVTLEPEGGSAQPGRRVALAS